jgi:curved DNA-binding protein CbpA
MIDYYEFLQISPNADTDTIHRVFRFLAARLHPDNPETGDVEVFYQVKAAYDVLSNPLARAEYDAKCKGEPDKPNPFSEQVDFMDSMDGELNRRLAVLAVLYYRRRTNPTLPDVGLGEIESRMGFPRDYLDFTIWYLFKKGYVTKGDNAQLALTADGVDFIETQRGNLPVLNKLLTSGGQVKVDATRNNQRQQTYQAPPPPSPINLPQEMACAAGRHN